MNFTLFTSQTRSPYATSPETESQGPGCTSRSMGCATAVIGDTRAATRANSAIALTAALTRGW